MIFVVNGVLQRRGNGMDGAFWQFEIAATFLVRGFSFCIVSAGMVFGFFGPSCEDGIDTWIRFVASLAAAFVYKWVV